MPAMRNGGGYVRVFRSMLDWEWYDDTACVRLMLHLLLTVNWEPKQWHGQTIQPGQLVTSMDKLAETLGTTRSAIRRTMDKLKSSGEVTIQTNNHWTTVTLGNWAEYQEVQPTNGRQKSQPTTDHRPTTDRPSATTEEVKKEIREEVSPIGDSVGVTWPKWAGPNTLAKWEEFKAYKLEEFRDRYKSAKSEQRSVSLLAKWFKSGQECVDALEEAMGRKWQFPVDPAKRGGQVAPSTAPVLNANGKPQQLKPWVN